MKRNFAREMDKNERIIEISKLLSTYRRKYGTLAYYHLIWDTPWENLSDYVANLELINQMKGPFELRNHSLSILPGTPVFDMTVSEAKKRQLQGQDIDNIILFYTKQYAGGDPRIRSKLTKHFATCCNICALHTLPDRLLRYLIRDYDKNYKFKLVSFVERALSKIEHFKRLLIILRRRIIVERDISWLLRWLLKKAKNLFSQIFMEKLPLK